MSYRQAMKWQVKHPKGIKPEVIMSTGSGFWPSGSFLREEYWPYCDECKRKGVEPMGCEEYYKTTLRGF